MTLRDLLKECRYKDVFNILYSLYYKGKDSEGVYVADMGYRRACKKLLSLPFDASPEYKIDLKEIKEDVPRIDVSLYCVEDYEVYAMDFTPWENLIDAEVQHDLPLDSDYILAHILWEITFYGFSSESIEEAKESLGEELDRKL